MATEPTEWAVPKLTDFGLSRLAGCGGTLTATGDLLGTRRHMPPEQLEGRLRDVGPWSDLFSLGTVLYELPTGRPAFPERDPCRTRRVHPADAAPRLRPGRPRRVGACVPDGPRVQSGGAVPDGGGLPRRARIAAIRQGSEA